MGPFADVSWAALEATGVAFGRPAFCFGLLGTLGRSLSASRPATRALQPARGLGQLSDKGDTLSACACFFESARRDPAPVSFPSPPDSATRFDCVGTTRLSWAAATAENLVRLMLRRWDPSRLEGIHEVGHVQPPLSVGIGRVARKSFDCTSFVKRFCESVALGYEPSA